MLQQTEVVAETGAGKTSKCAANIQNQDSELNSKVARMRFDATLPRVTRTQVTKSTGPALSAELAVFLTKI